MVYLQRIVLILILGIILSQDRAAAEQAAVACIVENTVKLTLFERIKRFLSDPFGKKYPVFRHENIIAIGEARGTKTAPAKVIFNEFDNFVLQEGAAEVAEGRVYLHLDRIQPELREGVLAAVQYLEKGQYAKFEAAMKELAYHPASRGSRDFREIEDIVGTESMNWILDRAVGQGNPLLEVEPGDSGTISPYGKYSTTVVDGKGREIGILVDYEMKAGRDGELQKVIVGREAWMSKKNADGTYTVSAIKVDGEGNVEGVEVFRTTGGEFSTAKSGKGIRGRHSLKGRKRGEEIGCFTCHGLVGGRMTNIEQSRKVRSIDRRDFIH